MLDKRGGEGKKQLLSKMKITLAWETAEFPPNRSFLTGWFTIQIKAARRSSLAAGQPPTHSQ